MQFDLRAQNGEQPFVLPGLLDEVSRSAAHGFHRKFDVAPGGHDDDRKIAVERNDFRKKIQAFLARRGVARVVEIDQQRIIGIRGQRLPDFGGRLGALHPIALGTKQKLESFENVRLIVGRKNAWRAVLARMGRRRSGAEILRLGRSRHELMERRR